MKKTVKTTLFALHFIVMVTLGVAAPAPIDHPTFQNPSTANVSSSDLGLSGPLSFSAQYSKEFGAGMQAKYLQSMTKNNALGFEVDWLPKMWRINGTWGFSINKHHRFKLSAEHLAQQLNFGFFSGNVDQWIGQTAIGATYDYLFSGQFIRDFNVNASYSKAQTKELASVLYDNNQFQNDRRIAGGVDKSISAGIDLLPTKTTLLGLQANYDDVHYEMKYAGQSNPDQKGLGATVSLEQLINDHVKLKLLASDRKPYDTYEADLNWLLKTSPGTKLEMQVFGKRILGDSAAGNDVAMGLGFNYSWNGGNATRPSYTLETPNFQADLKGWTGTPAVRMEQVLAVVDQQKIAHQENKKESGAGNGLPNRLYLPIVYNEPTSLDLVAAISSYENSLSSKNINLKYRLVMGELPKGLIYTEDSGKLTGEVTAKDSSEVSQQIPLQFIPENQKNQPLLGGKLIPVILILGDSNGIYPEPNPNFSNDIYLAVNTPGYFPKTYNINELFVAGDPAFPPTSLTSVQVSPAGGNISADLPDATTLRLTSVNGSLTPNAEGDFQISVYAKNKYVGAATGPKVFTIHLFAHPPSNHLTPNYFENYSYQQPINVVLNDPSSYLISPGSGYLDSMVLSPAQEAAYGLIIEKTNNPVYPASSPEKYIFTLKTTNSNGLIKPTLQAVPMTLTATNSFAKQIQNEYNLIVSGPPVVIDNTIESRSVVEPGAGSTRSFTAVDLVNGGYFGNPPNSGALSYSAEAESEKDKIHLSVDDGYLTGYVDSGIPIGTYPINVTASNDKGSSIKPDGSGAEHAVMLLSVTDAETPVISATYNKIYTAGQNVSSDPVAHIASEDCAIDSVTISPAGENASHTVDLTHNLTYTYQSSLSGTDVDLNSKEGGVAEPTYADSVKVYQLTVTNTCSKSATANFLMDVRGQPKVTDAILGTSSYVAPGDSYTLPTPINLNSHFENSTPTSDTMIYAVDTANTTPGITATISGNTLTAVQVGGEVSAGDDHTLKIHAQNVQSGQWSDDASYTVRVAGRPVVSMTKSSINYPDGSTQMGEPIAVINAGDGTVSPGDITVVPQGGYSLSQHHLMLEMNPAEASSQIILSLKSDGSFINNITASPESYTISAVNNKGLFSIQNGSFTLSITGAENPSATVYSTGPYRVGAAISPEKVAEIDAGDQQQLVKNQIVLNGILLDENEYREVANGVTAKINYASDNKTAEVTVSGQPSAVTDLAGTNLAISNIKNTGGKTPTENYYYNLKTYDSPQIIQDIASQTFSYNQPVNQTLVSAGDIHLNGATQLSDVCFADSQEQCLAENDLHGLHVQVSADRQSVSLIGTTSSLTVGSELAYVKIKTLVNSETLSSSSKVFNLQVNSIKPVINTSVSNQSFIMGGSESKVLLVSGALDLGGEGNVTGVKLVRADDPLAEVNIPGLNLDYANNNIMLAGAPTASGEYQAKLMAQTAGGWSDPSNAFTVIVDGHGAIQSITVTPALKILTKGETQQYTATAQDSLGNSWNDTANATWSVSGEAGTFSATTKGLFTAEKVGSNYVVTGTDGQSGTASLTINENYLETTTVCPSSSVVFLQSGIYRGNISFLGDHLFESVGAIYSRLFPLNPTGFESANYDEGTKTISCHYRTTIYGDTQVPVLMPFALTTVPNIQIHSAQFAGGAASCTNADPSQCPLTVTYINP